MPSARAAHEMYHTMLPSAEWHHALFLLTSIFFQSMWLPRRTELTRCLAVRQVLTIFALVAPLSSPRSSVLSCPMSNDPGSMRASAHTSRSDGVVPHAIPPLPLSEMRLKHPRLPSNPQQRISINPLRPHVLAPDRFTSWLTPYGIAKMNSESALFPPEIIIRRHLVMARCVLPVTLKNYAAGLSRFTKFCDDFNIPEDERMPAFKCLLSTFVTTHGAGSVGKGQSRPGYLV